VKLILAIVMALFLIIYSPLNSYAAEDLSDTNIALNMTTVDPNLAVKPIYFPLLLFVAFIVITIITIIVILLIRKGRKTGRKGGGPNFFDIIADGDYYPSLPRFQFLVWTFVISFVYLSTYLIRIYSGNFDAPYVDNNLLILLGISIVSPLLSNIISGYKYSGRLSTGDLENIKRKPFKSMLFESGKPALFRYQMFLWTFIGTFIFLGMFVGSLNTYTQNYIQCIADCKQIESLAIPKIDSMLVVLMGLSQSGYLGGKIVARTPARITNVFKDYDNKRLIVLGLNFGEKNDNDFSGGTVLINDKVVAGHSDKDVKWFDTKIEFPLPKKYSESDESFNVALIIDDVVTDEKKYLPNKGIERSDSTDDLKSSE
jgi:hypothetical protein